MHYIAINQPTSDGKLSGRWLVFRVTRRKQKELLAKQGSRLLTARERMAFRRHQKTGGSNPPAYQLV